MFAKLPPLPVRRWRSFRWTPLDGVSPRELVWRLALLVALVVAGDRITVFMTHQEWTLNRETVIALRLVSALPILRFPFEGFVMALEADKWDWFWLAAGDGTNEAQLAYQEWDKFLDLFTLAMALVVSRRWRDPVMRSLLIGTFAWRLVGVAAFLVTRQAWLLIAFPNVFENFFLMYVVFRLLSGRDQMLDGYRTAILVGTVALVPKLIEEYFLHFIERRPWDWVNLPLIPDGWEPRMWVLAMFTPAVLAVLALAWRPSTQPSEAPAPTPSADRRR